jgi:thioredoxin reductase
MDKIANPKRRQFLMSAGLGGAGAAAALVAGRALMEQKPAAERQEPGKGYRLTAHIQNYYRTARV